MDKTVSTVINQELCVGCGLCITVCPSETISLNGGKAWVTGEESLSCGHCAAICPSDAITVTSLDTEGTTYHTFDTDRKWSSHGRFDTSMLINLMASRRSCRNYKETPVPGEIIEDLIKIGTTAPSGTNSQAWTFTVLPDRRSVIAYAEKVLAFFKKLNRLAGNRWIRNILKLAGKKELKTYYNEYYQRITEKIAEWETTGKDSLFHGAPAAIFVGSTPDASCPAEDALLASQNILLAAHSMGLGTCLIGFAVEAMKNDKTIKRFAGIPDSERVYAVIALGYPNEKYIRTTGRKKVTPRYFKVCSVSSFSSSEPCCS